MRDVEKWMPSMGNLKQFPPVKRIQKAKSRLTRQLGLPPPWLLFDFFRLPAWLQGVVSHLARWPDSNRFFLDLGIFSHFTILRSWAIHKYPVQWRWRSRLPLESVDVQETLRMLASKGAIGVAIITLGPFFGALEDIVLLILGMLTHDSVA